MNLPSASELALIAAMLRVGNPTRFDFTDDGWMDRALLWWEAAEDYLEKEGRNQAEARGKSG